MARILSEICPLFKDASKSAATASIIATWISFETDLLCPRCLLSRSIRLYFAQLDSVFDGQPTPLPFDSPKHLTKNPKTWPDVGSDEVLASMGSDLFLVVICHSA